MIVKAGRKTPALCFLIIEKLTKTPAFVSYLSRNARKTLALFLSLAAIWGPCASRPQILNQCRSCPRIRGPCPRWFHHMRITKTRDRRHDETKVGCEKAKAHDITARQRGECHLGRPKARVARSVVLGLARLLCGYLGSEGV